MKEGYGPESVAVLSIDARLRKVADLDRNTRPPSTGTGGRNEPEQVADLKRNQWPNWAGICTQGADTLQVSIEGMKPATLRAGLRRALKDNEDVKMAQRGEETFLVRAAD